MMTYEEAVARWFLDKWYKNSLYLTEADKEEAKAKLISDVDLSATKVNFGIAHGGGCETCSYEYFEADATFFYSDKTEEKTRRGNSKAGLKKLNLGLNLGDESVSMAEIIREVMAIIEIDAIHK